MRELKFRAWLVAEKRMAPVREINFGDDGRALTVMFQTSPREPHRDLVHGENGYLMQCTGLKDAYGNAIYEGDIVSMEDATATVVFWERPPEFGLDASDWCDDWNLSDDSSRMEIIGNIYEGMHHE